MADEPHNLEQLIDRVEQTSRGSDQVAVRDVVQAIGTRSFGPLLLFAGLVTAAPLIGDVPGIPTLMGLFVILVALQLVLHRRHFWLPEWLLRRSVSSGKVRRTVRAVRRPTCAVDRVLRPRLHPLTGSAATHLTAGAVLLIGAALPIMEIVPFSANVAGVALTAFGLGLMAKDGLLVLVAVAFTAATGGFMAWWLL